MSWRINGLYINKGRNKIIKEFISELKGTQDKTIQETHNKNTIGRNYFKYWF